MRTLRVADLEAKPGEKVSGFVHIIGAEFGIPVTLICGEKEGETVLISGGVHNAEYVAAMKERQYRYNLIPFVEIRRFWVYRKQLGLMAVVTNLFGNVIGFLPFGFILPVILDKMRSGWLIVLAGFGLSVTVEVIQLITKVGCFDVDDMILNTAGAALGYLLFFICDHLRRKIYGKKI